MSLVEGIQRSRGEARGGVRELGGEKRRVDEYEGVSQGACEGPQGACGGAC